MTRPQNAMDRCRSAAGGAVALGVAAELGELLVERDEAEVQDVDAVAEVGEAEPAPGPLKGGDRVFPFSGVVWLVVVSGVTGVAERGRVADGGPGAARQFPDRCACEQCSETEAPPWLG